MTDRVQRMCRPPALGGAVLAVAAVIASGCGSQARIPRGALRVNVTDAAVSRPIPSGFIGFSIEYPSSIAYSGADPFRPDPVYAQLVRALNPGQSPIIRFGGDTADWTWWPTRGVPKPPGIRYTLTHRWVEVTRATARLLGARLILGINFEADRRAIAATESRVLLRGIGRRYIAGFELGNEPEAYSSLPWYTTASGRAVPGRPRGYGLRAYLRDYARVSAVLPREIPLVGPASGAGDWLTGLRRYLVANPRVRIATFHRYPLHRCSNPRHSVTYPTIRNLLAPTASRGPAMSLRAAVRAAHARGVAFRSDELNSVSCGGAHRVSDTFASALWIIDTLFNMARVGVDGVNIHTFRTGVYAPFVLHFRGHRWSAQVKPMYYGLLLFARAAPPGARLVRVSPRAPSRLRLWAARAPTGRISLVVINDSPRRPTTIAVRLPGHAAHAEVERLRAPRVGSTQDVTLAGEAFKRSSFTGLLSGPQLRSSLAPVRSRFVLTVAPGSATLLTAGGA